jgi:late competence protein required for DNA uptake (superfamily II DNA/RNA helicase)
MEIYVKVTKLNGQQKFVKLPNIKYHENPLVVLKLLHIGKWTDGQTDRHKHKEKGRQAGRQTWQSSIAKFATVL